MASGKLSPFALVYTLQLCFSSDIAARRTPGGPGTKGTGLWLDDIDKNFDSDLSLHTM